MVTRLQRSLLAIARTLGFRAALFSLVAVGAALLARYVDRYLPQDVPFSVDVSAVGGVLGALATSMLTITVFSLSTMMAAFAAATDRVTPRARRLLQEDRDSLNALSTFVGAFLFSLVGLIALGTGYYGERGRFVLFLATMGTVVIVVVTLLRWIDRVSSLGGVTETVARIETTVAATLGDVARQPALGGVPANPHDADAGLPVQAGHTGYLQHVDMHALQAAAEGAGVRVHLACLPGAFVTPGRTVAHIEGDCDPQLATRVRDAFTIGDTRDFQQDPRFGLIVLSEVASHALSPAINDPGTAIDVISRVVRLLLDYRPESGASPGFPDVSAPMLDVRDLLRDAYVPIARDGPGQPAVMQRLQKALLALAEEGDAQIASAAAELAAEAAAHSRRALAVPSDVDAIDALARRVHHAAALRGVDAGASLDP